MEMRNKKGLWGAAEYRTNKAGEDLSEGLILDTLCNPPHTITYFNRRVPASRYCPIGVDKEYYKG